MSGGLSRMLLVFAAGLMALAGFVVMAWLSEIPLLWATEGFKPKPLYATLVICLSAILVIALLLLTATFESLKRDHSAYLAQQRTENTPPKVESDPPAMSPIEATIQAYRLRGFTYRNTLEAGEGPQVWAKEATPDDSHIFRRPGALIYRDGTATQFSVAVIYQDDVWALGSEINAQRGGVGRAVTIRTILNRPTVRELILVNDYVLGVGVASSSPSQLEGRNQNLAHARAINIAVAIVHKLKLKDSEHALGASLGYALAPPRIPAFEPRQRAVILIGINASREVDVDHVIIAAGQLITVDGVDLASYQHAGEEVVRSPSVATITDYQKVADVGETRVTTERWTLPARHK